MFSAVKIFLFLSCAMAAASADVVDTVLNYVKLTGEKRIAELMPSYVPQIVFDFANTIDRSVDWVLGLIQSLIRKVIIFFMDILRWILPQRVYYGIMPKILFELVEGDKRLTRPVIPFYRVV